MASLGGRYLNPHKTQFDGSPLAGENCTPTSGANGANAATGGKVNRSGGSIRSLVPRGQETDPGNPGWSIPDLDKAMARLGVPYENQSGRGWAAVIFALNLGKYVTMQGDSDRFSNSTCSGAFNGNHCIGVHPASRVVNLRRQRWIDDPICKTGRWEYESVIHAYAAKISPTIHYGVFTTAVPKATGTPTPPVVVTLKYGGTKLSPAQVKRIAVPAGQKANVRQRPTTAAALATAAPKTLANGSTFTAYQVTKTGQLLAGSRTWYGDKSGNRWLHVTAF